MLRLLVVISAVVVSLLCCGSVFAADHIVLTSHEVALKAAGGKPPPVCHRGQRSTRKHPCRKGRRTSVLDAASNPPAGGWQFGLGLTQNADGTWRLSLSLSQTTGAVMEQHVYGFQLPAEAVTVASDLSSAKLDTGTAMGQFGSVRLTFAQAGPLAAANPSIFCSGGTWQTRTGSLSGTVDFATGSSYFRTVLESKLTADVTANTGSPPTCQSNPPPPTTCTHESQLVASAGSTGPYLYASVSNPPAPGTPPGLQLFEFATERVGPATISHALTESGLPVGDLTLASDLSTGTIKTTGATRFSGSITFTATGELATIPSAVCGGTSMSRQGTTAGDLAVHYAAPVDAAPVVGSGFAYTL